MKWLIEIILVFFCLYIQAQDNSDIFNIIFSQDFEDNTLGPYVYNEFLNDWKEVWSEAYKPEDGLLHITENDDPEQGSKVFRLNLTEGSFAGSGIPSGGYWDAWLDKSYDEIYFSYRIKFKPGFEWVHGGKIPGVRAGESWDGFYGPPFDGGFVNLLMWSEEPTIANYYYYHGQTHEYGATSLWNVRIKSGKWYTVTLRTVLNTISDNKGNNDAIFEGYIDGRLVSQITGFTLRNVFSIGVDRLAIGSFFGGAEPLFAAAKDEWIEFDDFVAFTYKEDIDVPRGNVLSPSDRILTLPGKKNNNDICNYMLNAYAISGGTVKLEWNNCPGSMVSIQRRYQEEIRFTDIAIINPSSTSYFDEGLNPNTTYYYRLRNNGYFTDSVTAITPSPDHPIKPTSLILLNNNTNSVRIGWNDNANNETGYIVERSDNNQDSFMQISKIQTNTTQYLNNSLAPNTVYYFRVAAFNEYGVSDYSNILQVSTLESQPPGAPSNLVACDITANSFTLKWNDNSENETGFEIFELDKKTNRFLKKTTVLANISQYKIYSLQPYTSYGYKVRAFNYDGYSSYSNYNLITTLQVSLPACPFNLRSDSISSIFAYLSWIDNALNEDGFFIYRSVKDSLSFQRIGTLEKDQVKYIDSSVSPGQKYYYKIKAFNNAGISPSSNAIVFNSKTTVSSLHCNCFNESATFFISEDLSHDIKKCSKIETTGKIRVEPGNQLNIISNKSILFNIGFSAGSENNTHMFASLNEDLELTIHAGNDQVIFYEDRVTLEASLPDQCYGYWSLISGENGIIDNIYNPKSFFTPGLPDLYRLRWSVSTGNGCSAYDDVLIYYIDSFDKINISDSLLKLNNIKSINNLNNSSTENFLSDVQMNEAKNDEIAIYPNPFSNLLVLVNSKNTKHVEIIDLKGIILFHEINNGSERLVINTEVLPIGYYYLRLTDISNRIISRKIVKPFY